MTNHHSVPGLLVLDDIKGILDHEAHSTSENLIHPKCLENSKPPKQHRRVSTIADKLATTKSLIGNESLHLMRLPRLQKWMLYASSADVARCRRNILLFSPSSKFRPRVRWKAKTRVPLGMEEPSPARNGAAIPVEHHFVCILLFCKNANFVQCLFSCGIYGRSPVNLLDRGGSKPKWLSAAKRGSKSRGIAPRFTKLLSSLVPSVGPH